MKILLFAFAAFVSTLCGGLFGIRRRKRLHAVISFTAGVLIAVALFDLTPEIAELSQAQGLPLASAMAAVALGFLMLLSSRGLRSFTIPMRIRMLTTNIRSSVTLAHPASPFIASWVGWASVSGSTSVQRGPRRHRRPRA